MVGFAFTLRYVPAREDLGMQVNYDNSTNVQRIAVESLEKDDVLVIDARGDINAASFGHIIATRIKHRGAAGLFTDGALRDTPRFRELDFPTYIKAPHATTSSVVHPPADMNVAIGCGGVLVMPGDVIVGDAEGVVVIPSRLAEEVSHAAYQQDLIEEFALEKVKAGASIKGVYPPDEKTRAEFAVSRAANKAHQGD
jgi:regulator of RNase E activity RraA